MFHRVADSAPVCSILSRCLSYSGRAQSYSAFNLLQRSGARRWQTIVSAQTSTDDGPSASSQELKVTRSSRHRNNTYTRHWTPPKTAELGIDVLGRPAEVFILPSRDRKILRAPNSEGNNVFSGIQESLASELQPISREEVKQNIEDIKERFGQGTVELTSADWQDVKAKLASGFTKKQLRGYIVRSTCAESDRNTKDDQELDNHRKSDLATDILENVWKFRLIPETEVVQIGEKPSETHTKQIQVTGASLDLALLDTKQPLKEIAEKHRIQLDVFRQQGKIELHGDQQAVSKAQRQLRKLFDSFVQESMTLSEEMLYLLDDDHIQEDLLNTLMQKHTVKLDHQVDKLQVLARNVEQINLVRRDLHLATDGDEQNAGSYVWQLQESSDTIETPVYPPSSRNWFSRRLDWERSIAKDTEYKEKMTDSSELKSVSERIFRQLANAEKSKLKYYFDNTRFKNPGPQMNSYILDLGQVLSARKQLTSACVEGTSAASTKRSLFASEIPHLPQTLAKMVPAMRNIDETTDSVRPSLIRIRLLPLQNSDFLPSFELLLTGKEGSQGLKQPLQIHKVSAVLSTSVFDLLLPTQAIDIRISKVSICELFDRRQGLSDLRRLRLLKSFAGCVDRLQNSADAAFDPVLKLDLSDFINGPTLKEKRPVDASSLQFADAESVVTTPEAEISMTSQASDKTSSQQKSEPVEYLVEPPEILDTRLYQLSQGSSNYIEHIFADAGLQDIPRYQELLQVVHVPTSQVLTTAKKSRQSQVTKEVFHELLKASIDLILNIGKRGSTARRKYI